MIRMIATISVLLSLLGFIAGFVEFPLPY